MARRMLIDATHPEETRVAVVDGHRLEEFDFEIAARKPLKGNIYLAKVTRVEPSLQAAFVDYGGNRHGFLAFSEIHPDYYRIPVADREALLAELDKSEADGEQEVAELVGATEEGAALAEPGDVERIAPPVAGEASGPGEVGETEPVKAAAQNAALGGQVDIGAASPLEVIGSWQIASDPLAVATPVGVVAEPIEPADRRLPEGSTEEAVEPVRGVVAEVALVNEVADVGGATAAAADSGVSDDLEESRRRRARQIRRYKIQEVIKRRQIMLVQVTKEERGNKGAALTTYLSLAGRYCVLMPNTPRGGGISRKITSPNDRKRLKSIIDELDIPDGIAVIVRTAGSERSKAEIKRDYEYLLRLWDEIRELTLRSTAPTLVYEEANLIKRAIRDLYSKDIEDVLVEGEEGYKSAKAFMKMLTPSHAKRVQLYKDPTVPLFPRYQVEAQIDAIHQPIVQLRSGGYIVLNQTEALVAIDVNSGRATRERHIEETALKTNLEAADEIARQLRLRDLAGLIVIDFIDMEDQRHNSQVERRLKEALKHDRARIQMGRISHFGLLEMSRQRLRPSLIETSTVVCRHCGGTGHVRSTESTALHLLRAFEEEGIRRRSSEITVTAPTPVCLYILNQKRAALMAIEQRYGLHILLASDDALIPPDFRIERTRLRSPEDDRPQPISPDARLIDAVTAEEEQEAEEAAIDAKEPAAEEEEDGDGRRRRRPRRRRRRRGEETGEARREASLADSEAPIQSETEIPGPAANGAPESEEPAVAETAQAESEGQRRRRRRGKRGGRRRRRPEISAGAEAAAAAGEPLPESGPDFEADDLGEAAEPVDELDNAALAAAEMHVTAEPATATQDQTRISSSALEPVQPRQMDSQPAVAPGMAPEPTAPQEVVPEAGAAAVPQGRTAAREAAPPSGDRDLGSEHREKPLPEPQSPIASAAKAEPPQPRRRGWWQRVLE